MTGLHIDGTHMDVLPPPVLNEEEEECLDFKGPTSIDTARVRKPLPKT